MELDKIRLGGWLQLNGAAMRPRRDYCSNRLLTGALQLPHLGQLLVDEAWAMAPGTLAPTGLANLQVPMARVSDASECALKPNQINNSGLHHYFLFHV